MAKATRKKAARKKTGKKAARRSTTARKSVEMKTPQIPSAKDPRSKSEVLKILADNSELSKKQVQRVFDVLGAMIKKDLGKAGPGVVNVAGMMKVTVQRKPATKARKGVNPFTGEEMMFKAKPARNVIKVRPLKALKDLV